jgi:hypothetical protein
MICNVCGNENRCYTLSEDTFNPRPISQNMGIKFRICTDCLIKLITPIMTEQTKLDPPEAFPIDQRMQLMINTRENARVGVVESAIQSGNVKSVDVKGKGKVIKVT